ncbi:glycosyltransferase [Pelomonas sp. SE-A7]|uniref:glycosyltransferase n=1 Tax=Pelomonas sp. SE-A7 TaxID=3054953 RepID=UPI00259CEB86|nr:glycosyltransferase [Pelomonas sp. SE-A7]MDM4765553.1 glycosyltransferase [Pelomonas sp. SE-A7]
MAEQDWSPHRRVMHFVTGGFSGATQVAVDLATADSQRLQSVLVLRRKDTTDQARVDALRERGLEVEVLPGWSHLATIWALYRLCKRWRPDVLVAHGFPEHILGRWAGWLAGVPALVQIEHNSRERYSAWKLWQARWLSRRSARLVGVSEGVRQSLVELGMPEALTMAIPNGIDLGRFAAAESRPYEQREPGIVMSARFARQKDQETLIHALALLRKRGLAPKLYLAGAGKANLRKRAEELVRELGLGSQVWFLGHHPNLPELLMSQQLFVLSTHWEGMPLALVEGMAAGCACVASNVPGVEGVFEHGRSGLLVPERNENALADALERLLLEPGYAAGLASEARLHALRHHGHELMMRRYEMLLLTV